MRQAVFFIALCAVFFSRVSSAANNTALGSKSAGHKAMTSSAWSEWALDSFAHQLDDLEMTLEFVSNFEFRLTSELYSHRKLVMKWLEWRLASKDRASLEAFFSRLFAGPVCKNRKSEDCIYYADMWNHRIGEAQFFETTAGKMEKIRRNIEQKKCTDALILIKEVLGVEGSFLTLIRYQIRALDCLNLHSEKSAAQVRLGQLQFLQEDT